MPASKSAFQSSTACQSSPTITGTTGVVATVPSRSVPGSITSRPRWRRPSRRYSALASSASNNRGPSSRMTRRAASAAPTAAGTAEALKMKEREETRRYSITSAGPATKPPQEARLLEKVPIRRSTSSSRPNSSQAPAPGASVRGRRPVPNPRAGDAGPVGLEGVAGGPLDPAISSQPEVVVGAEHDRLPPLHLDHRAGLRGEQAEVGEEVVLLRRFELFEAIVVARLLEDVDRGLRGLAHRAECRLRTTWEACRSGRCERVASASASSRSRSASTATIRGGLRR